MDLNHGFKTPKFPDFFDLRGFIHKKVVWYIFFHNFSRISLKFAREHLKSRQFSQTPKITSTQKPSQSPKIPTQSGLSTSFLNYPDK